MELQLTRNSLSDDVSKLILILEDAVLGHLGRLVVSAEDDGDNHWLRCRLRRRLWHDDLRLLHDLGSWLLIEEGVTSLDLLLENLNRGFGSRHLIGLGAPDRLGFGLLMGCSDLVKDAFELVDYHLFTDSSVLEAALNGKSGWTWVAGGLELVEEHISHCIGKHGLGEWQSRGLS